MTVNEFITHLYKNIWNYIIYEECFQQYWKTDEDREYTPCDFYSEHIPKLINDLKKDLPFQDAFKEIVGVIDLDIRQIITNFISWFSVMENKTWSDIYNDMFRNGIYLEPLDDLIKIVKNSNVPLNTDNHTIKNKLNIVFTVIDKFTSATKPLINRRKNKSRIDITDEYDIQDILHVILKPFFPTLKIEEVVTGNDNNKFLKIDFLIPGEKTALECKYIRDSKHANNISKELNDDIQTYIHHQDCNNLIFFLYDKEMQIESPDTLESNYTHKQKIEGKEIQIYLKIRPKN